MRAIITLRWDMRLTDKEVLQVLMTITEPVNHGRIAKRLDCAEITVRRSIGRLKSKQIISEVFRGRGRPSEYIVHKDKLPEGFL